MIEKTIFKPKIEISSKFSFLHILVKVRKFFEKQATLLTNDCLVSKLSNQS